MELWFTNAKTQKLFSNDRDLVKKFGDKMAARIMQRLADLNACDNFRVAFSLPGRLHNLKGNANLFAMDLVHPFRLIVKPSNDPLPFLDEEKTQLNFDEITEIEIVGVVDYH